MKYAEQRADWEQQADNERRRFLEERPGYEQCPKHPERPVVDSGVCTLRYCAECVEDHQRNYVDRMIERDLSRYNDPATWPADKANQGGWLGHTFTKKETQ